MTTPIPLHVDEHSPIPIRRQLAEQLKHAIEAGDVPRDQALPSIRELASALGINPNTVARAIEELKRSGYVEARRGKGVFIAPAPPVRSSPTVRERLLRNVVIRAAALGMTADAVAVGVLSLAGVRPPAVHGAIPILLVDGSPPELDFLAGELEAHLAVRVDKVLLADLAAAVRGRRAAGRWGAAVTSFAHLPEVERRLDGLGVSVVAIGAEASLETLHRLARLPSGTRVGVAAATVETARHLEHSLANARLANITLVGACPAEAATLGRLVRRASVVACSSAVAERVRALAGPAVQVIVDDRALDPRAIEMLAALLVRRRGDRPSAAPPTLRKRPPSLPAPGGTTRPGATRARARATQTA
ncbi:MAG TPA: GntR family transcriptional regulator, partial [Candidatus Limnocylindrales bacterium]|nr:GntR family transcriptional regulator [Candidatus Limnocylindrales bacterium]